MVVELVLPWAEPTMSNMTSPENYANPVLCMAETCTGTASSVLWGLWEWVS